MDIRTATPADAAAIRSVARRSFQDDDGGDGHLTERLFERRYAPGRLDARLERTECRFVLAERDDEVLGFAEGTMANDGGRVERLHVAPAHRSQGVGRALYERLDEEL